MEPAGTPREIVAFLHNHISTIMKMQDVRDRFASQGTDAVALGPKEFGDLINRELALNSKVIKAVGMRAD